MDSMEEIKKRYVQNIIDEENKQLIENSDLISNFIKLCKGKGINLTSKNFSYIQSIGIVASYPNILNLLNSNIVKDKEDLVKCNVLTDHFTKKKFASGFLYAENYMAMAHHFFRRGFNQNSNFSPRFIELFWEFDEKGIESFIGLDFNRVRINVDNSMYMEFDTWYGASFKTKIDQIPDGNSKLRPPSDIEDFHISFFFKDAYSLDIKWATKNGIKSFQAEEFKTDEVKIMINEITYYPVRYVHAEFDIQEGYFRHFDGAVHLYTESEYYQRRDSDFNHNAKESLQIKSKSLKLFKMNGKISIDVWIKYTSHFFTGNPLIIEYFEGKYPENIRNMLDSIKNKQPGANNGYS